MTRARTVHTASLLVSLAAACNLLSGCVMVGYSSRSGFFVWPGSIGFILLGLLLWFLFRSR